MRKIIVSMRVTLDGFIAGPNNEMDFVGEVYDEAMGKYEYDLLSAADTLLLGRVTYESFAGAWPYVPDRPGADPGEELRGDAGGDGDADGDRDVGGAGLER